MTANKICIINQKAHYKALAFWLLFKKKKEQNNHKLYLWIRDQIKKKDFFWIFKNKKHVAKDPN